MRDGIYLVSLKQNCYRTFIKYLFVKDLSIIEVFGDLTVSLGNLGIISVYPSYATIKKWYKEFQTKRSGVMEDQFMLPLGKPDYVHDIILTDR